MGNKVESKNNFGWEKGILYFSGFFMKNKVPKGVHEEALKYQSHLDMIHTMLKPETLIKMNAEMPDFVKKYPKRTDLLRQTKLDEFITSNTKTVNLMHDTIATDNLKELIKRVASFGSRTAMPITHSLGEVRYFYEGAGDLLTMLSELAKKPTAEQASFFSDLRATCKIEKGHIIMVKVKPAKDVEPDTKSGTSETLPKPQIELPEADIDRIMKGNLNIQKVDVPGAVTVAAAPATAVSVVPATAESNVVQATDNLAPAGGKPKLTLEESEKLTLEVLEQMGMGGKTSNTTQPSAIKPLTTDENISNEAADAKGGLLGEAKEPQMQGEISPAQRKEAARFVKDMVVDSNRVPDHVKKWFDGVDITSTELYQNVLKDQAAEVTDVVYLDENSGLAVGMADGTIHYFGQDLKTPHAGNTPANDATEKDLQEAAEIASRLSQTPEAAKEVEQKTQPPKPKQSSHRRRG